MEDKNKLPTLAQNDLKKQNLNSHRSQKSVEKFIIKKNDKGKLPTLSRGHAAASA